jgi:hypothetical protein
MPRKPEDHARGIASTVKRLNEAVSLIVQANATIDKVQVGWSVPDAPEQPPVIQALTTLKVQASHAANVAQRLLASMQS